jgi:hypothetical protein
VRVYTWAGVRVGVGAWVRGRARVRMGMRAHVGACVGVGVRAHGRARVRMGVRAHVGACVGVGVACMFASARVRA